jgi:hypothetical protein
LVDHGHPSALTKPEETLRLELHRADRGRAEVAEASQERSMSLERHRHNSKLSTFMQSEKYFSVPVTELR